MAKYTRHDPQNKKRNKHKQRSQEGKSFKMRSVESYNRTQHEEHHFSVSGSRRSG